MREMLTILAVALVWSFLWAEPSAWNLLIGSLLGVLLLSVMQRGEKRTVAARLLAFGRFALRFVYELLMASVAIGLLAFRPRPRFHPHIIGVPLRMESDAGITMLAVVITLLPGTVAMGVSEDRRTLYAHAINEEDPARARDSVTRMETLILGFMS